VAVSFTATFQKKEQGAIPALFFGQSAPAPVTGVSARSSGQKKGAPLRAA
jgi:hypothetical protein